MAASASDLLTKVGTPGTATTLAAPGFTIGNTSISVGNTANWPTDTGVVFAVDQVTTQIINGVSTQVRVAGTYCEFEGTVLSSTQIGNLALKQGTSQNYPAGSNTRVYIPVASTRENNLVTWGLGHANQDGSLKTSAVQTALNLGTSALNGWNPLGFTFTYGANNGNKEFTVTTPSDLTATLSKGMKLQFTRGTTAPTQSMAFTSASSQYAAKTSPTGITFTAACTLEAWINPQSYTGVNQGIISRWDGANGFVMYLNSSGQVVLQWQASSTATSNQTIPLNRWTHVAVAVSSFTTPTVSIYINGIAVPITTSGTSALVQSATSLMIGSFNGGAANSFFNGYISEARIWSVAQTQANVRANMSISLIGSETSLVGLFQGNSTFADKTANANTLTATNGAIATQAANPYNNVEYGILTNISYSNPTTTLTIFTGTDYNIPNLALSSPQYSTQRTPFGFPGGKEKWLVQTKLKIDANATATGSYQNLGSFQLSVPTGSWDLGYQITFDTDVVSGSNASGNISLSTSPTAETDTDFTGWQFTLTGGRLLVTETRSKTVTIASPTTYYAIAQGSSGASQHFRGDSGSASIITAYCGYL